MMFSKNALIAAAVTGAFPASVQAAALNQNLVLNPSFENVSAENQATEWAGNVFTYAYAQNYTGPAPGGAGNRYWFGGGGDPLATQLFDLTGNASAIDGGTIGYNLSAFFSTYLDQKDYGTIRALFLNGGQNEVGRASIGGAAFVGNLPLGDNGTYINARAWGQDALTGLLPVGTRSVLLQLDGDKDPAIGAVTDGYVDLVNFEIAIVPEPSRTELAALALGMAGGWMLLRRRR